MIDTDPTRATHVSKAVREIQGVLFAYASFGAAEVVAIGQAWGLDEVERINDEIARVADVRSVETMSDVPVAVYPYAPQGKVLRPDEWFERLPQKYWPVGIQSREGRSANQVDTLEGADL